VTFELLRPARFARWAAVVLSSLTAPACAQNAVLDVQLMLPPTSAASPTRYALVQVRRSAGHDFEDEWLGDDADPFELSEEPTLAQLSVDTTEPATDLRVKVLFCETRTCDSLADARAPQAWFELEQPLYLGRRTAWAACLSAIPMGVPTAATSVSRCEIHGCIAGAPPTWCSTGSPTRHYCETLDSDVPPRELSCAGGVPQY
jgi:hypothetical protein